MKPSESITESDVLKNGLYYIILFYKILFYKILFYGIEILQTYPL